MVSATSDGAQRLYQRRGRRGRPPGNRLHLPERCGTQWRMYDPTSYVSSHQLLLQCSLTMRAFDYNITETQKENCRLTTDYRVRGTGPHITL